MKYKLIILLSVFSLLSCNAEENNEVPTGMNNITISNFPVLDGSDSTSPLRYILMCKLLGFDYEGQAIIDESGYVSLQTASTGIRSLENESKGAVSGSVASSGKDVPIYNLSGQRLKNPNKGINIIGNKKILMK